MPLMKIILCVTTAYDVIVSKFKSLNLTKNVKIFCVFVYLFGLLTGVVALRCTALIKNIPVEDNTTIEVVEEPVENQQEAVECARILYGIKDYNLNDNQKIAVIEVIINRSKYGTEFPTSVIGVCQQVGQWQGYRSDSQYLQADYELALSRLNDKSGARVIPEGCYFLLVGNESVTVRTNFNGGNQWTVN